MEGPIGRYARASEDYTGSTNVAHVLGARVANTISIQRIETILNHDCFQLRSPMNVADRA